MRKLLFLIFVLSLAGMASAQPDCPPSTGFSSTSSDPCGVAFIGSSGPSLAVVGAAGTTTPALSGTSVELVTASASHVALNMNWQSPVNIEAFNTTFTFIPDGLYFSFVINNYDDGESGGGKDFQGGAGCEGSFSQSAQGNPIVTNVFAVMFDGYGYLKATDSSFTYSSVQIYQQYQSPCNPSSISDPTWPYFSTTKLSTSPVPLNSPATTQNTTTGDTYGANLVYDGSNLTLSLCDETLNGTSCLASCPSATCFTHEWSNLSIPSLVNGTTAYIGLAGSTGSSAESGVYPLYISGWTYTVETPTASPGSTPVDGGASTAANPVFSPAPGTYTSPQTVTISCATSDSSIAYSLGDAGAVVLPLVTNIGTTAVGTTYSAPLTVSSTSTLYANCGVNNNDNVGYLPSGVVQGLYTITNPTVGGSTLSGKVVMTGGTKIQ